MKEEDILGFLESVSDKIDRAIENDTLRDCLIRILEENQDKPIKKLYSLYKTIMIETKPYKESSDIKYIRQDVVDLYCDLGKRLHGENFKLV